MVLESSLQNQSYAGRLLPSALHVEPMLSDLPLVTESIVQLTVQPEDNGHRLVCRAENLVPQSALEGTFPLEVACKCDQCQMQASKPASQAQHCFICTLALTLCLIREILLCKLENNDHCPAMSFSPSVHSRPLSLHFAYSLTYLLAFCTESPPDWLKSS